MEDGRKTHGRFTQGTCIRYLGKGLDVRPLLDGLASRADVWNRHRLRTEGYGSAHSPHAEVHDVWVRYNDYASFDGDLAAFNGPHDSVWYPAANELPVKPLVRKVMAIVGGDRLGGVLITRVPAGAEVKPHIDNGWHARYYDKYAVQLAGNAEQAFCFDGESLSAEPGDLYTFDNSKLHWVTNPSKEDRMTLIICIRGSRFDA